MNDRSRVAAVVDDDGTLRETVAEALEQRGYEVLDFADGLSALRLIESDAPLDLLIADLGLPHVNGRVLAQVALSMRPRLKVVVISGDGEFQLKAGRRLERLGKPFSLADLRAKIDGLERD